jgi:hypothetical protein
VYALHLSLLELELLVPVLLDMFMLLEPLNVNVLLVITWMLKLEFVHALLELLKQELDA